MVAGAPVAAAAVVAGVVVVVVVTATVVGGVGVVPPLQEWMRPMEASSAFLQVEKLPRQLSLIAFIPSKLTRCLLAL